ncbi:MAG TPA: hypothetical protein VGK77_14565 [Candidatus Binatia bacterium]|jgi:uncharacterized membrane protein
MDRMLVVIFESESRAHEGYSALSELHADGSIVLYAVAVIAKDFQGIVSVKRAPDQDRFDAILGMATESLIKLLAERSAGAGVIKAGIIEKPELGLASLGTEVDFVNEVSLHLLPGTAGVIAEVDEDRMTSVNRRIENLGGLVFRSTRKEVFCAVIERDVAALEKEVKKLKAQFPEVTAETKAKLHNEVDKYQADLLVTTNWAKFRAQELRREAEAKIVFLQEQAAMADGHLRAKLEERICAVRVDYAERARKLNQVRLVSGQSLRT